MGYTVYINHTILTTFKGMVIFFNLNFLGIYFDKGQNNYTKHVLKVNNTGIQLHCWALLLDCE